MEFDLKEHESHSHSLALSHSHSLSAICLSVMCLCGRLCVFTSLTRTQQGGHIAAGCLPGH